MCTLAAPLLPFKGPQLWIPVFVGYAYPTRSAAPVGKYVKSNTSYTVK
jgi:hypothetical protein